MATSHVQHCRCCHQAVLLAPEYWEPEPGSYYKHPLIEWPGVCSRCADYHAFLLREKYVKKPRRELPARRQRPSR